MKVRIQTALCCDQDQFDTNIQRNNGTHMYVCMYLNYVVMIHTQITLDHCKCA